MQQSNEEGLDDYEDELANMAHTELDDENSPERPTSAPPNLDVVYSEIFKPFVSGAGGNGAGEEDSFPIITDDTFSSNVVAASGSRMVDHSGGTLVSPLSAQSDIGVFSLHGGAVSFDKNDRAPDPRKRTQSIEKFLAQSPGSILGPRKRYNSNSTGAPRAASTSKDDDALQYITAESPGRHLRQLRKNIEALDLNAPPPDEIGNSDLYGYPGSTLAYVPEEEGDRPRQQQQQQQQADGNYPGSGTPSPRNYGSASVSPSSSAMPSPLHSPSASAGQTAGGNVDDTTFESQGAHGGEQQHFQQQYQQYPSQAYYYASHMSPAGYSQGGYGAAQSSMYVAGPYGMQMHQGAPMTAYGTDYTYQQQQQQQQPGYVSGSDQRGLGQQTGERKGGAYMNAAMQKVILPNGVEAMVVPSHAQMPGWPGLASGMQQPPPPAGAPPAGNIVTMPYGVGARHDTGRGGAHYPGDGGAKKGGPLQGQKRQGGYNNKNSAGRGGAAPVSSSSSLSSSPSPSSSSEHAGAIPAQTPLSEYKGAIFQLSQEQNGCRYLQQKVDRDGSDAVEAILHEVSSRLVTLMLDPFGNYLFQKLLDHATPEQSNIMLLETKAHLIQAALNLHGTRSVQKFIEIFGANQRKNGGEDAAADVEQLDVVIGELRAHITKMSMDTNGNHVVQRCLQFIPKDRISFVYDTVVKDVLVITRHRHGCCVFQRCIDAADASQRNALVGKVIEHAVKLMQDPFGNYVVQYVLEKSRNNEAKRIIAQLQGRLEELSMQKFSSNVVEKCLQNASAANELAPLIEELCDSKIMQKLLNDQYANYVVQRALVVADDNQGKNLVQAIRPHMAQLAANNVNCARRVSAKVIKRFPALSSDRLFSAHSQQTPQQQQQQQQRF